MTTLKFDYKPRIHEIRSPVLRRALHVSLGFSAVLCLSLAFSVGKKSTSFLAPTPSTDTILAEAESSDNPKTTDLKKSPIAIASTTAKTQVSLATSSSDAFADLKPVRTITKDSESLDEEQSGQWHTLSVRGGDTLAKIFNRLGIPTKDIHEIINSDPACRRLATLQPGQSLKIQVSEDQQVSALTLDIAPGNTLQVSRIEEGFQAEHKIATLEKQLAFGKGAIEDSLFSSGKRVGLDHKILAQMVEIFGSDIDFSLDLQPQDTFRVLYEKKYLEGTPIETGNILAAEIHNAGKKHQAIRYTDKAGHTGYFTPEGYGLQQGFSRNPVNFTRISSGFGARRHPILHRLRQHKGVDYSAPYGTPVQATGDGKIIFMGTRGGYGKTIELQHGARYTTLYAHLSKFPKNIKVGKEIRQGETIGFVGQTGLATGPHLHYEFRIDGIHRNPLTIALPKSPLNDRNKRHFIAHAREMLRLLDIHENKINVAFGDSKLAFE